ncbi:heavy-metal-associated domain-containing protein [Algivirga pacifica]|uniref:HMA domain-containing protein n=1 Tax=Algivirga pacifica TaxID=1162670 RepID=A0ABP9DF49_9BACT
MKTYQFHTNINCGNCIAKVTPALNEEFDILEWSVDTDNPKKVLTVKGEDELTEAQVMAAVEKVGFKIEKAG